LGTLRGGRGATRRPGATVQGVWNETRTAHCWADPCRWNHCARPRGWRLLSIAALLLAASGPLSNRATYADQSPTEYQVKAAYLFNFLKFVEWPDDASAEARGKWTIGIVGDSPVGDELIRLVEGKTVLGRELQVKKFQAADDLRHCNILFISPSEKRRLPSILASLRGSSVLTVADMDNFVRSGGMIQLVVENDSVRLAIDVGATSRARLKVSSKLLSLARVVTGTEEGANR
jgi:YfiR/HmsC-like